MCWGGEGCVGFGLCWMIRWGCWGVMFGVGEGLHYGGIRELLGWERGFICSEGYDVVVGEVLGWRLG